MKIFKDILLPALGILDPTGIINALSPAKISKTAGVTEDIVERVLDAVQGDPEFKKAVMAHEEVMQASRSVALLGLDTGAEFSFLQGLLGSPRRFAVTIMAAALGYLIFGAGTRALFVGEVAKDVDGLVMLLKFGGATLFGLATAYVSKGIANVKYGGG